MSEIFNTILEMLPLSIALSTPLIIAGIGGLYSERCGIVNIALEACMVIGGFTGASIILVFGNLGIPAPAWFGILFSFITGGIFVSLLAFAAIHMKADQTIAGTALNVLSLGLTVYLSEIFFKQKSTPAFNIGDNISKLDIPILSDIPIIGDILFSNIYPTSYLTILLVFITWFVLYKTRFGLRLRSCGEYPQASASMGINVIKMRWIGVILSGSIAGVAGAVLVLTSQTFFFQGSIHGLGFVAISTLIFGKYNPWGVLCAGLFFGFVQTIGLYANSFELLALIPSEIYKIFPYILTIIALVIFSNKAVGPKASGEIYDSGKR